MRVCIAGPKSCPPVIGGIEVFSYEVGRRLAARGTDVTVIVPRAPGQRREEGVHGIRVLRIPALRNRYSLKVSMVPQEIIEAVRAQPDIFHANDPPSGIVGSMHLRWRSCVLTVHGVGMSHSEWPTPFRQGGTLLQRIGAVGADVVATTDTRTASMLKTFREDVKVIPSGVDISLFSRGKHPRPTGFDERKINILHVGRLTEVKGTDLLVESLRFLSKEAREALSIKVIGNGPLASMVADATNSHPTMEWLGEVPHDEIAPYFCNADMLVMPSRSEGLPISMLEAMSCMVPVIGTLVGGIGTYFDERHLTVIPEPTPEAVARTIEAAVRDKGGLAKKASEAKALVDSKFSWEAVTDQYMRLYEETLS